MPDVNQLNLRIPTDAFDTVRDLAKVLRADPSFRHQLQRLLDERSNHDITVTFGQRLDRLERQVAELQDQNRTATTKSKDIGERCDVTLPMFDEKSGSTNDNPQWTKGEGRGSRLTREGEEECDKQMREGKSDAEIARFLGVKANTVTNRRKRS